MYLIVSFTRETISTHRSFNADPRRVKGVRVTPRKERPAPRKERERRREQAPDSGNPQANDNMPPPGEGAGPQ